AIDRDTTALAFAQQAYLPDFEVYIERFFNAGRRDGVGVVFSATIPLAYREKYDAGVAEAKARVSVSKADLRTVQETALAEVKSTLVRAQPQAELVNLFTQTHIPQAEQALSSSLEGAWRQVARARAQVPRSAARRVPGSGWAALSPAAGG